MTNLLNIPKPNLPPPSKFDYDEEELQDELPPQDRSKPSSPFLTTTTSQTLRSRSVSPSPHSHSPSPYLPPSAQLNQPGKPLLSSFWTRNKPVILVASAQLFGAIMNLNARLLELDGEGMHPFQILFARMSITTLLSSIYMYYTSVPHFPFGPKKVRGLLIIRGFSGFFGIYGMWYSMLYLPLAEATVITFLAPCVAGYICHLLLKDPFTRKEQIASFIALFGVILIAKPTSLFSSSSSDVEDDDGITPGQRIFAIFIALTGVLGAAGAYTTIRWIGKRCHPLITVTYFSVWSTIVSTTALLLCPLLGIGQPEIQFGLPASGYQWVLLLSLGLCGFIMQFMLTAGIGGEKSNRATAMVYTHMIFAGGFDRFVFGHKMGVVSVVGCGLILGGAMWAALGKKKEGGEEEGKEGAKRETDLEGEEGVAMLGGEGEEQEEGVIELEEGVGRVR
ncbi:hypothetical protein QBC38DRAFT_135046 [Podospora fimiseda]|uniref:EamA domain-containing protein n=1 Tax=Podospora fimiseda TaxID=252190 RepID=A0AAN7BF83_9PEZI|nr:hypothetical protein QBC38DRAFT_135046 [Podospora fimiseda]